MKLSLLVMRCKNIDTSKLFCESLGFQFQREKHGNGPEHYSAEIDGFVFELYPNKGVEPMDNTRIGFKIDNLNTLIKNFEIDSPYEFNGSNIYVVKDPDGRKVELS